MMISNFVHSDETVEEEQSNFWCVSTIIIIITITSIHDNFCVEVNTDV